MPEAVFNFAPLVVIALLFWLLLIRPTSKRQKELRRMQSALSTGDEVMLTSGIVGVLRDAESDAEHVRVEIADGVTIKVARGAIGSLAQTHDQPHDETQDQEGLASDEPEEN